MKTNKMLSDSSISKVWENFRKMNGIIIEFLVNNWVSQSNDTFTNTVEYDGFTSDEILEVDLYDDGALTETQITEYDGYITEFNVEDGKIVAVATTKPTQDIRILCRGEIVGKMVVNGGGSSDISASNMSCLDKDGQTSNVQKELDEQSKKLEKVLLWENNSETTTMNTLSINMDLSEYSEFIVVSRQTIYNASYATDEIHEKDLQHRSCVIGTNPVYRLITFTNSGVSIGNGYSGSNVDDTVCIPVKIYGRRY